MSAILKITMAIAALAAGSQVAAQVTFYQNENYSGGTFTTDRPVQNFRQFGFNGKASSVVVTNEIWEVCDRIGFAGRCTVLRPGQYPSLTAMGLTDEAVSVRQIPRNERVDEGRYAPVAAAVPANAQVVFYEGESFQGRSFTAQSQIDDFTRFGFNDLASSAVVLGDQFEACENVRFGGRCVVLRPGRYASLADMNMGRRVSSVRGLGKDASVADERYAPVPLPAYDNRRRSDERLYEANVTSVRAVLAADEQRCWMEPAAAPQPARNNTNIGGAIAGALIGGILGHQVGGGSGKNIATVGGAVAGAAVGANVGRLGIGQQAAAPEVQKCATQPSQARTEYYDVVYTFRGQEHKAQMTSAPGSTITVNGQGEPRA